MNFNSPGFQIRCYYKLTHKRCQCFNLIVPFFYEPLPTRYFRGATAIAAPSTCSAHSPWWASSLLRCPVETGQRFPIVFLHECFQQKFWKTGIFNDFQAIVLSKQEGQNLPFCTFFRREREAVQDLPVVHLYEFIPASDCKAPYFLKRLRTTCKSEIIVESL